MPANQRVACVVGDAAGLSKALPFLSHLVKAGCRLRIWAPPTAAAALQAVGAEVVDLWADGGPDQFDPTSSPIPMRTIAFAAARLPSLLSDVRAFAPGMMIYCNFALAGALAARILDLPLVMLLSGHAPDTAKRLAALKVDPRLSPSPQCLAAIETLRKDFGYENASIFSYIWPEPATAAIYREPAQWLTPEEHGQLGHPMCFGSLADTTRFADPHAVAARPLRRIYAAFGTVVWRYWPNEAVEALEALAHGVAKRRELALTIGLGGVTLNADLRARLAALPARVLANADQPLELAQAELFVTHNGLGSTHEAVAAGVPMLSYPFFWDQPALARRAAALGVARPLVADATSFPAAAGVDDVLSALDQIGERRREMAAALTNAQIWEREAIAGRPAIVSRLLGDVGMARAGISELPQ